MKALRAGLRYCAALLVLLWVAPLQAHSLDIAHFRVYPAAQLQSWRIETILPSTLDPALPVNAAAGCSMVELSRSSSAQGHLLEWQVECEPGVVEPALQTRWGRDGAIVELHALQGEPATALQPGARLGARLVLADPAVPQQSDGFSATAQRYTWLGTTHVLIGWDHLAFVFCLAMLARGTSLLWLISAFTLGHSVSLAASFLGIVRIPIAPVEAVIALSVVFMAREAWLLHLRPDMASGKQGKLVLTAGFGLIHGLGFASVLGELGVSASDTITALAFFNIGVEIGQLLFVAVVLGAMALLARVQLSARAIQAALCVAGGMGMFWTLQRIAGL